MMSESATAERGTTVSFRVGDEEDEDDIFVDGVQINKRMSLRSVGRVTKRSRRLTRLRSTASRGSTKSDETALEVIRKIGEANEELQRRKEEDFKNERSVLLTDRRMFLIFSSCVTVMHMVTCAIEVDARGNENDILRQTMQVFNISFCTFYFLESVHRFRHHGLGAFENVLHVLDTFIVILSGLERIFSDGVMSNSLPAVRLYRVWLFVPAEAALPLALVVDNFTTIVMTLFWFSIVTTAILWAIATWMIALFQDSPKWNGSLDPSVTHEPYESFDVREYFGSFFDTFLSICEVVLLDEALDGIIRPTTLRYGSLLVFFFMPLMLVVSYGLMSSVFATFTAVAVTFKKYNEEVMRLREQAERTRITDGILRVMQLIDDNMDGFLSAEEIDVALKNNFIRRQMQELGIPTSMGGNAIVNMIDASGDALLTFQEFRDALTQLNNPIQPKDFIKMSARIAAVSARATSMFDRFLSSTTRVESVYMKYKYGTDSIKTWLEHLDALAITMNAKEKSKDHNPYKYMPAPPKEWLAYTYKPPPPSYDKEVRSMCQLLSRISPQTPLPPELSPEKLPHADGEDDQDQFLIPRGSAQSSSLRSGRHSNRRTQSAPLRRNESGSSLKASDCDSPSRRLVFFEDDSRSSSSIGSGAVTATSSITTSVRFSRRPSTASNVTAQSPISPGRRRGSASPTRRVKPREDVPVKALEIGTWDSLPPGPPEYQPPPLPALPHTLNDFEVLAKGQAEHKIKKGSLALPPPKQDRLPPPEFDVLAAVRKHREKKAAFHKLIT